MKKSIGVFLLVLFTYLIVRVWVRDDPVADILEEYEDEIWGI